MTFWAYILHCNAGVFYTGHTDDLDHRIAQHKAGAIEGFTRRHLPVELVWSQEFTSRDEAKAAEKRIKGWSRKKKMALIRGDRDDLRRLAKTKGNPSTSSGQAELSIGSEPFDRLQKEARASLPRECCGILLGRKGHIEAVRPTRNVHPTPETHFEIDPQALIDAHRAARQGGAQVLGYYHSHPKGPAHPSATDRAMAAGDGGIWAIIGASEVRFWRDLPEGFAALSYSVEQD